MQVSLPYSLRTPRERQPFKPGPIHMRTSLVRDDHMLNVLNAKKNPALIQQEIPKIYNPMRITRQDLGASVRSLNSSADDVLNL